MTKIIAFYKVCLTDIVQNYHIQEKQLVKEQIERFAKLLKILCVWSWRDKSHML